MKIKYNINKLNKTEYCLWKTIITNQAVGIKGIFSGSKYACQKYAKENNIILGKVVTNE